MRVANLIVLILAIIWLIADPGLEQAIAVVAAVGALFIQQRKAFKDAVPYDHPYTASDAPEFYDRIAGVYDARNSDLLIATHKKVIETIANHLRSRSNWSVLDLCGGTGRLIAFHFSTIADGHWISVDSSGSMRAQFERNLRGTRLPVDLRSQDIYEFLAGPGVPAKHDVVLLALALSSLPRNPDWERVAAQLKTDGILVVADIEPSYAAIHPYYTALVGNETHALRTRPVHLANVISEATDAGLVPADSTSVHEGEKTYSYIQVFRSA
ncbi:MAG: methyltransferase domain-containing protein [Coriobacteriia bacterium]|nr:methyltransferase domain-containing protein [Coriobacteriia bacterium]